MELLAEALGAAPQELPGVGHLAAGLPRVRGLEQLFEEPRHRVGPRRLLPGPPRLGGGGDEAAGERQDDQGGRGRQAPVPAHQPAQLGERAFRLGQRHGDLDLRARAGGRGDAAPPAEQAGALFDAREPQPAGLTGFARDRSRRRRPPRSGAPGGRRSAA